MLKIEGKVGVNASCKQNCCGERGAEGEGERAESVSLPVCQPGSEFELCITYRGGAAAVAEERTERLSLTFVKDGRGRSSHHRRVSGCVCVCVDMIIPPLPRLSVF